MGKIRAVVSIRETLEDWRNWEPMDWAIYTILIPMLALAILFLVVFVPLALIFGDSSESATEGDLRTQRYECSTSWSPATKTNMTSCDWETLDYQTGR
jgi:hypothetical protein